MVNLDFSDGTSPPSDILLGRRKSPRKHPSNPSPPPPPEPAAAEQVTKKKKKNKKKTLGSSSRIWYEDDELTVLKGLVDYQAEKGNEPNSNWADFYRFLGDSFTARFSKDQVLTKIRKLKAKFLASMQRGNTTKSEAFRLSKKIWGGPNESDQSDIHNKSGEEEMANDEPSNDEVTKAEFESNDESWAVRDAFETMVSRGLSDYQKKLQLEKLMNLGSGKRKELSDEWKELCAEEVKLNSPVRYGNAAAITSDTNYKGKEGRKLNGITVFKRRGETQRRENENKQPLFFLASPELAESV